MSAGAQPNQPLRGIAWMMTGVICGVSLDVCVKWLLDGYSLAQVVFLRSLFGFLFLVAIFTALGRLPRLRTSRPKGHALRSVLSFVSAFTFFFALKHIPLAEAITIAFAAPLLVTALSVPLLGEHVGLPRWSAVIVGFSGVVIAMRPGPSMLQPATVSLLVCVVAYALLAITARRMAADETPESLATWVYPVTLAALIWPTWQSWTPPDAFGWLLLIAAGILSALAFLCINAAYRWANASVVVPFEYTALVWATAAGALIWNEMPDRWVLSGAAVIIASGLFILYRESRIGVRPNTFPLQDISVSRLNEAQSEDQKPARDPA